jgi:hypothetical protein
MSKDETAELTLPHTSKVLYPKKSLKVTGLPQGISNRKIIGLQQDESQIGIKCEEDRGA